MRVAVAVAVAYVIGLTTAHELALDAAGDRVRTPGQDGGTDQVRECRGDRVKWRHGPSRARCRGRCPSPKPVRTRAHQPLIEPGCDLLDEAMVVRLSNRRLRSGSAVHATSGHVEPGAPASADPRPDIQSSSGGGSSEWALACGSTRVLANVLVGCKPAIDVEGLGIGRLRR